MVASLCLYGCLLVAAQTAERPAPAGGDWTVLPRLNRADELVFRGTFIEEANGSRVQFNRSFRIENRLFVLDTPPKGAEVAVLTVLRPRDARPKAAAPAVTADASAWSARLEIVRVDLQGKVLADPGVSLLAPVDGPPTLECGLFVELPAGRLRADKTWETPEEGRPARSWRVAGTDVVNGVSCVKLVAGQKSEDWDQPRADRTAWRRQDTVWLAPRVGFAYRVERVIERRDPAHKEPTQKSVLRYELESTMQYVGQLGDERRQEIGQVRAFAEAAATYAVAPAKFAAQLNTLANRIAYHLEHQPSTPYREAMLSIRRRVEAAKRGEAPAPAVAEQGTESSTVAALGHTAPDFVVPDFTAKESARLRRFLGKPILMVFYHPASPTTPDLLRYAQKAVERYPQAVTVLGMAWTEDAETVRKQRGDLGLTFPILNGTGLRISYAVEATPKVVLIDGAGVVRGTYLGWGEETSAEVLKDLQHWLPRR
jgi:peroxiredoxin